MRRPPSSGPIPGNRGPSENGTKRQGPGPKSGSKKFAKIVAPAPLLAPALEPVADLDRDAVLRSVNQGAEQLSNKHLLLVANLIETLNQ